MSECRRCGTQITQADIDKGRALQRGEFMYCPACVAEARAAKGGSAAPSTGSSKPAPASVKAAPASARAASPASRASSTPGMKPAPAPASSKNIKPAPKPAPAAAKDKYADLIDDEPAAAEEPAEPQPKSRGPASSRLGKSHGAPAPSASGRLKKAASGAHAVAPGGTNGEMEDPTPGSLRRPIGFKDSRGTSQTLTKQQLLMFTVGGVAFLIVALVLFFTLFVKKAGEEKKAKDQIANFREATQEFQRILREEPDNFELIFEKLNKAKEIAKGNAGMEADAEELAKSANRQKEHKKLKMEAAGYLDSISAGLEQPGGGMAGVEKVKQATAAVKGVGWVNEAEQKGYNDRLVRILKRAQEIAEKGKTAPAPDLELIGGLYLLIDEILKPGVCPPDFPPAESQKLIRDIEVAVEAMYLAPGYLEKLPWKDLGGADTDWKADEGVTVERTADGISLSFTSPAGKDEKAGLFYMNQQVGWRDYIFMVEFTASGAFQLMQRVSPSGSGATHDLEQVLERNWKLNEKTTAECFVYAQRWFNKVGGSNGMKGPCPPTQGKTGGVMIRVPAGVKIMIHKIQVKIMRSDEDPAPVEKK